MKGKSQEQQVIDTNLLMNQTPLTEYTFNKEVLKNRLKWLKEEVSELEEAVETENLTEVFDAIEDTRVILNGFYPDMGINYTLGREVYNRIIESNNSKICLTPEHLISTIEYYQKQGRDIYVELVREIEIGDIPKPTKYNLFSVMWNKFSNDFVKVVLINKEHIPFEEKEYAVIKDSTTHKYLKNVHYKKVAIKDIVDYIKIYGQIAPSEDILGYVNSNKSDYLEAYNGFNNLLSYYHFFKEQTNKLHLIPVINSTIKLLNSMFVDYAEITDVEEKILLLESIHDELATLEILIKEIKV